MSKRQTTTPTPADALPPTPDWLADFLWSPHTTGADVLSFARHVGISAETIRRRAEIAPDILAEHGETTAVRVLDRPFVEHYRTRGSHMDRARFLADLASWPPIAGRVAELKAAKAA